MRIGLSVAVLALAWTCAAGCGGGSSTAPTATVPAPTPTPTPTPSMAPPSGTSLTACGTIAFPGSYSLASDIGPASVLTCLRVTASNVVLDCGARTIAGYIAIADNLANITIRNCTITGMANLSGISNVTISHSAMSNILAIAYGVGVTIDHNIFSFRGGHPTAAVALVGGNNNTVTNNTIDGGYHGQDLSGGGTDAPGTDDGIVLGDERGDTISGNTIANVFDAGIEGVNTVADTTIANNTITNAVFAGISSYHCTSWQGDTVTGNIVFQSLKAIEAFVSIDSLCTSYPNPPRAGAFINNVIANNTLRNALDNSPFGISLLFNGPSTSASGNVLQGNDVGAGSITAVPPGAFSNGGGNTCGASGNFGC